MARLHDDKDTLIKTFENALPQYNYCALYLRYCRPYQFDWSSRSNFGIKTLVEYGCTDLNKVDQLRSPFELLTHTTADTESVKQAWQQSPEWAREQLEDLGNTITFHAKEALTIAIERAKSINFPVTPEALNDNGIEGLKDNVRWSPIDLAECCTHHGIVQKNQPTHTKFYGCSFNIKHGLERIAEDMTTNRKPRQVCFAAVDNGRFRPVWLALWGEFKTDNYPTIPLQEGNKLGEAKIQLEGFFHWYQFAWRDSQWTWFELSRNHWEPCPSIVDLSIKLLSLFDSNTVSVGHLFVAEDYPSERQDERSKC
jgi:hypothetical protein